MVEHKHEADAVCECEGVFCGCAAVYAGTQEESVQREEQILLHLVEGDECAHSEDALTPLEHRREASAFAEHVVELVLLRLRECARWILQCSLCAVENEGEEQRLQKSLVLCEHRLVCGKKKKKREGNNKRNNLNIYKKRRK